MNVIEQPIGNLSDEQFANYEVDYVNLDWDEARRRTQKVVSEGGVELGLRLNIEAQTKGLTQDDIFAIVDNKAIALNINEAEVITVKLTTPEHAAKVAYEIGNFHAPTFYSQDRQSLMTPYTRPLFELMERVHAHPEVISAKLLNSNNVSSVTSAHTHTHGNESGRIVSDLQKHSH